MQNISDLENLGVALDSALMRILLLNYALPQLLERKQHKWIWMNNNKFYFDCCCITHLGCIFCTDYHVNTRASVLDSFWYHCTTILLVWEHLFIGHCINIKRLPQEKVAKIRLQGIPLWQWCPLPSNPHTNPTSSSFKGTYCKSITQSSRENVPLTVITTDFSISSTSIAYGVAAIPFSRLA